MAYYVIAGKANCANFIHAVHVSQHLNKYLPRFKFKVIEKAEEDWANWLDILNAKNRWRMIISPVVWKEVSIMGGRPYLIGNLSEFWEYCYDYYGFQSFHSRADIKAILDEYEFINSKMGKPPPKCNIITILGGWRNPMLLSLMIYEVHNSIKVADDETVLFKLFDSKVLDTDEQEDFLFVTEELYSTLGRGKIEISQSLIDSIKNSDCLLVIKNFSRKPEEPFKVWLQRCHSDMYLLAEEVNYHARRELRIILCHPGPVCFTASILVKNITSIRLANIVAVTSDEGLATIESLSRRTGVPVAKISCPPVWGFSGVNSYVDIGSIFLLGEIYKPYARALKSTDASKLPNGEIKTELRLMNYLIDDEEKVQKDLASEKSKLLKKLKAAPNYSKVRATGSLIRIWLTGEPLDDVISLGVCSNGSFGFPSGIVFSQAVILNEKRFWEPFGNFPLTTNAKNRIPEILLELGEIINKHTLGSNFD